MLNPIDADAVIRDGGAVGRFPGEIHEGVAWWLGACLVVTHKTPYLAVAHNGHPAITAFADRLCRGAINAEHYACHVRYLGRQSEQTLLHSMRDLAGTPGAYLAASTDRGTTTVRVTLYNRDGIILDDTNGLAEIRRLIAEDRVPIPVNAQAKGYIEHGHPQLTRGADRA